MLLLWVLKLYLTLYVLALSVWLLGTFGGFGALENVCL